MSDCCLAGGSSENYSPKNLVDGNIETNPFTIAAGQTLSCGEVCEINGSNEVVALTAAANASVIMPFDVDTTAGATSAAVYVEGTFNEDELSFAIAVTPDDVRVPLRNKGIHIRKFG